MTDPKDYLRKMVDATINQNPEEAEQAFKDYMIPKTMDVLGLGPEKNSDNSDRSTKSSNGKRTKTDKT